MLFESSYLRARLEEIEFVCMCFELMRNLKHVLGVGTQPCFPRWCVGEVRAQQAFLQEHRCLCRCHTKDVSLYNYGKTRQGERNSQGKSLTLCYFQILVFH